MALRMGRFSMYLSVAILAAAATTPTQCQQPPPGSPAGSVVYKAHEGETPYSIAKRLYGEGYLESRIREANPMKLNLRGVYSEGTMIVVPPDLNGRPVDLSRFYKEPY